MNVGFITSSQDKRCPVGDTSVKKFKAIGVDILIEKSFSDQIADWSGKYDNIASKERQEVIKSSDILYSGEPLSKEELSLMKSGSALISFYAPFNEDNQVSSLDGAPIHAFSMDMIPRTTLAQSMDVLSSMASIAGYKAVLLASERLPRYFPMMMTAAGTVKPATVLILGAGVAGLQAIATAKRLGAKVEVFDVRKAVKEECESLGAKFIEVEGSVDKASAGGYAVEQTEDYQRRQKEKIKERVANADVVITTAQLRGRKAPILVTEDMIKGMKTGSVIVDLAASTGGNCEFCENNTTVVKHGVEIIGDSFLHYRAMQDASTLLSNNIYNYASTFIKDNSLALDFENEIIAKSCIYSFENKK